MTTEQANERRRDDIRQVIRDAEALVRDAEDLLKAVARQADEQDSDADKAQRQRL